MIVVKIQVYWSLGNKKKKLYTLMIQNIENTYRWSE